MLVLTRKMQESIQVGEHIRITILRIKGSQVQVGIEAPRDVRIVRGELACRDQQRAAARVAGAAPAAGAAPRSRPGGGPLADRLEKRAASSQPQSPVFADAPSDTDRSRSSFVSAVVAECHAS